MRSTGPRWPRSRHLRRCTLRRAPAPCGSAGSECRTHCQSVELTLRGRVALQCCATQLDGRGKCEAGSAPEAAARPSALSGWPRRIAGCHAPGGQGLRRLRWSHTWCCWSCPAAAGAPAPCARRWAVLRPAHGSHPLLSAPAALRPGCGASRGAGHGCRGWLDRSGLCTRWSALL